MWPSPDDDLVVRAKSGDEAAWRDLYEAHAGRLLLWLRSRPSGDAAVAFEDVAAEAWLTAAQRIADFSGNSSYFAGWLFGIDLRLVLSTMFRAIPNSQPANSEEDPVKPAIFCDAISQVSAAAEDVAAAASPVSSVPSQTRSRPACST